MTRRTLDGMALGGMYDLVGGGFHRYSVDERWLVPHFEKMLYDNALLASVYLHAARRFGDERYRAIADAHDRLRPARARARGRRLRLGAGRRHRRRRRADVHLGAGRRLRRTSCCSRSRTGASCCAASSTSELRQRLLRAARGASEAAARRQGDRVVERADAGRARAGRPASSPPSRSASSCSARSRRRTAACTARGATASRRGRATSRTTPTSPTACSSCTSRPATRAGCARRTASRRWRSSCSPTSDGGFFQAPVDGEQLVARKKELDDHPTPSGNAMLAYVLLRARPHLGRRRARAARRVGATASSRDALQVAPSSFGWMLVALEQQLAPHRELAIVGSPADAVARAALGRAERDGRRRLRPGRGRPAARGAVAGGRRAADRLPLRAVRVQPAGHGPRERLSSQPMALLEIRNVTRRFGGIVAIDDVSLDVQAGQIVGLIGPNGAGKTTLFNVVTRLYKPDSGAARVRRQEPAANAAAPRRSSRDRAHVPERRALPDDDGARQRARRRPYAHEAVSQRRRSRRVRARSSTTSGSPTSPDGLRRGCRSGR